MSATALRTSINADLQLLSEEKLEAVSKYVRIFVLHKDTGDANEQVRGRAYQEMLLRLSDLQEYEQGWDDGEARPLNRSVVKNFKAVLEASNDVLLTGWTIFPAANGTLLLEYKPKEAGINIGKDDFSFYSYSNGTVEGKNSIPFSTDAVIETMKRLSDDQ